MNDDLISRDALMEEIVNIFHRITGTGFIRYMHDKSPIDVYNKIIKIIDNAPTVCNDNYAMGYQDGVKKVLSERPQGEWAIDGHHYKCSRCGKTLAIMFSETDDDDLIGCPFCLADMRVKDELKGGSNNDH